MMPFYSLQFEGERNRGLFAQLVEEYPNKKCIFYRIPPFIFFAVSIFSVFASATFMLQLFIGTISSHRSVHSCKQNLTAKFTASLDNARDLKIWFLILLPTIHQQNCARRM